MKAPTDSAELVFAPGSPWDLFTTYFWASMQSFGGAISFVERAFVRDKRWLTPQEFLGLYAISRALPGPSGISLCVLIGDRFFGVRGALAAVMGSLLVPSVLVLVITSSLRHAQQVPAVQGMLYGMGAASIGVVINTAIRMSDTLRSQPSGVVVALLAFVAIGLMRQPLVVVMATLGAASVAWTWQRLSKSR